ncbi:MAG: putative colanic acid biosynthesis acetyltransferase [Burkholderiaceae bacterium]
MQRAPSGPQACPPASPLCGEPCDAEQHARDDATIPFPRSSNDDRAAIHLSKAMREIFVRGRSKLVEGLWFLVEWAVVNNSLMPVSAVRLFALRLFGARIGTDCRCPHAIRVKFPWKLTIGDRCWLGDGAWLYNQAHLTIGSDVCISRQAFITTESHGGKKAMDLQADPIVIEDGVWITPGCILQKGVTVARNTLVTPGSVLHRSTRPDSVYGGSPAEYLRPRFDSFEP